VSAAGRPRRIGLLAATLLALVAAGCGSGHAPPDAIGGDHLTLYLSLPENGASVSEAQAVLGGATIALSGLPGHRLGRYDVRLRVLDDSTAARGEWDPGQTSLDARTAAADPTAIGYIGELNSGASAVSIPLLERAGIPQISPTSTAIGLTDGGAAADPGEPQKYYPTGIRTFVRLPPGDGRQATVQAALERERGCTATFVLDDGEVDGEAFATSFALAAPRAGIHLAGTAAFAPRATDFAVLAGAVAAKRPECILIAAVPSPGAVALTVQLAAALPHAALFASAGLAAQTYVDPARGGIPQALDPRLLLTVPVPGPAGLPPAGRAFAAEFTRRYGPPLPAAILGYESTALLIDAIRRASTDGEGVVRRSAVRQALFGTRSRRSVLGVYDVTPAGDTTLDTYGVYAVRHGRLAVWRTAMR
jgi:branched-chain amino acid transport system substrate-binding protein